MSEYNQLDEKEKKEYDIRISKSRKEMKFMIKFLLWISLLSVMFTLFISLF